MKIISRETAPCRHDDTPAYTIGGESVTGDYGTIYGAKGMTAFYRPTATPTPTTRSHKCKGIMAAKQRAKEARAAYLRGVAGELIDKRLDFVLHLWATYHAAKVEAAMTHKRGRVAGAKRLANLVAALAAMHGVADYPVTDIVDAFTATLYPDGLAALTRAWKRRRQGYRGAAVEA